MLIVLLRLSPIVGKSEMTDNEKIEAYKIALARWEEEYRCYGPRGTIARDRTGITRKKINDLRRQIAALESSLNVADLLHREIRKMIYG